MILSVIGLVSLIGFGLYLIGLKYQKDAYDYEEKIVQEYEQSMFMFEQKVFTEMGVHYE